MPLRRCFVRRPNRRPRIVEPCQTLIEINFLCPVSIGPWLYRTVWDVLDHHPKWSVVHGVLVHGLNALCGVRVRARKGGGMVYGLDACRYVITSHSQTSCAHVQAHVQVIS